MSTPTANPKAVQRFVWTVSIVIPLVVLALFLIPPAEGLSEETLRRVYWLPRLNAVLNASAFTCLLVSLMSIRKGLVARHRALNTAALSLSALFLVSYVTFHFLGEHTVFGDVNHDGVADQTELSTVSSMRLIYRIILLSHILFSVAIVPLALFSYARGLMGDVVRHRKIAKVTMPMWLYVTATGVIVYVMISPYYPY